VTEHDELRARLARLDPAPPSLPVDLPTSPRAHQLLERAMLTTASTPDTPTPPAWRRPALLAAAAAAVVALGAGGLLAQGDDGPAPKEPATTLALRTADSSGGTSMSSCLAFDVAILRGMPVAFAGTVTDVSGGTVTLDVDHWYKGGDADVVTVTAPGENVALDGIELVEGTRYLVTATDGTVNTCGFTGEATPDLVKAFDEAFAP